MFLCERNPMRERGISVDNSATIVPRLRVGLRCRLKNRPLLVVESSH